MDSAVHLAGPQVSRALVVRVAPVEPGSIRSEAVGKLDADARQIMSNVSPQERALYQDAFPHLISAPASPGVTPY